MNQGLRIVIVEDDCFIAMDLADILVGMGHEVRAIAATEAEAVSAAGRCSPDLMIVDGTLAEGSGVSAMRQILANRVVPHFYITGDPQPILMVVKDAVVVAKPFTLRGLQTGIAKARYQASNMAPLVS